MDISILTPTYNRGEYLKKLYESLINQTCKEFVWVIVDDGSTDSTETIIKDFELEKRIKIQYIRKNNGGKHTALNVGIKNIETSLVFIVDSDDWICCDAIEKIIKIHRKYEENKEICGYSFLRSFSNGLINGKSYDKSEFIGDYIDNRINKNDMNSDKAEVWKTDYLKEIPFPEFDNEKFLGEDVVWMQLSIKYKMVFVNEIVYISEYLDDGLTQNRRINNLKSPRGCFYRSKVLIEISRKRYISRMYLIKNYLQYQIYGMISGLSLKELYDNHPKKIQFLLFFIPSYLIYCKWKKNIKGGA